MALPFPRTRIRSWVETPRRIEDGLVATVNPRRIERRSRVIEDRIVDDVPGDDDRHAKTSGCTGYVIF